MGIKRLQQKFIFIATAAIIVVLSVVLIMLNFYNYNSTFRQMYRTLRYIASGGGEITLHPEGINGEKHKQSVSGEASPGDIEDIISKMLNSDPDNVDFTGERRYSLRYYSAVVNPDRSVEKVNIKHIASVNEEEAAEHAVRAVFFGGKQGRFKEGDMAYAYVVEKYGNKGQKIAVFMDCTAEEAGARLVIRYSMLIGFVSLLFLILIVSVLSRRAMKPVIANIENQKAFITNAGHELKTPLAIISANTEVLEMTQGGNEWTASTRNQINRLTVLINNLITLSKTTEAGNIELTEVDFSECANEACLSYRTVILQQEKNLVSEIEEDIKVMATKDGLSELINILLDNAAKYCDEKGTIRFELKHRGKNKGARLVVSNDFAKGEGVDYSKFFERFYRGDSSHNSKKAGYGIGLSMAKGFAEQFKGKIQVSFKDGVISFTVTF